MSCPDHQTISLFADGELEGVQAAEIGRHVAECETCRQLVEDMHWLEDCGRVALGAIQVREATTPSTVWWRTLWPKCARPLSLAAGAALVLALSICTWFASSHFSRYQAPSAPHQIANVRATPPGTNGQSEESENLAFEQWAAPYRELHIPLVPMEVAESYNPAPILPVLPENIERNH